MAPASKIETESFIGPRTKTAMVLKQSFVARPGFPDIAQVRWANLVLFLGCHVSGYLYVVLVVLGKQHVK